MGINFKVKIRINGKEYSSVEEMPDDLRQLYEKAMQGNAQSATTKIKFNGQEFDSLEAMPPEIRKLYEGAIEMIQAHPQEPPAPGQLSAHSGEPSPAQSQQIAEAIGRGNKIEAIRLYRAATGTDLASAKEFIEMLAATLHEKDPSKCPASAAGKGGCLGLILLFLLPVAVELLRK